MAWPHRSISVTGVNHRRSWSPSARHHERGLRQVELGGHGLHPPLGGGGREHAHTRRVAGEGDVGEGVDDGDRLGHADDDTEPLHGRGSVRAEWARDRPRRLRRPRRPRRPASRRRVLGGPARGQPPVRHVPGRPPLRRPGRRRVRRGRAATAGDVGRPARAGGCARRRAGRHRRRDPRPAGPRARRRGAGHRPAPGRDGVRPDGGRPRRSAHHGRPAQRTRARARWRWPWPAPGPTPRCWRRPPSGSARVSPPAGPPPASTSSGRSTRSRATSPRPWTPTPSPRWRGPRGGTGWRPGGPSSPTSCATWSAPPSPPTGTCSATSWRRSPGPTTAPASSTSATGPTCTAPSSRCTPVCR